MKYFLLFFFIPLLIASCSPQNKPINFGNDVCEHCEMTISEPKWGAEIVTNKGKVYKFDSIECLIAYISSKEHKEAENLNSMWTINYHRPGELIETNKAFYLLSSEFHSPMGMNIASFYTETDLKKYIKNDSAKIMKWDEIVKTVKQKWML